MRRQAASFEDLILENKKQLLNDPEALDKIEKRIEERVIESNNQVKKEKSF